MTSRDISAEQFLRQLGVVARAVAWQSGESETDTVGIMVSILHQHPEWLPRFMKEGAGLFIEVGFGAENGSFNWRAINGNIVSPEELFEHKNGRLK